MIIIENVSVYGFEESIRGMRNPLNSWEKSDSKYHPCGAIIGGNDFNLMKRLNTTTEQSKYKRMIVVYVDIVAPLYWWKEFDTYKVGTVRNSCSTMHTITKKPFEEIDFSTDKMTTASRIAFDFILTRLNALRDLYLQTKDNEYWNSIIQILPSSYNQRATVMLNYEVLTAMYRQRKAHKLTEWREFCEWVKCLPYSELITKEEY